MIFSLFYFFFFNDTATTEIYTLSLHDALPICVEQREQSEHREHQEERRDVEVRRALGVEPVPKAAPAPQDRKSTRLNSSHLVISYAVFCLKKKKIDITLALQPHDLSGGSSFAY